MKRKETFFESTEVDVFRITPIGEDVLVEMVSEGAGEEFVWHLFKDGALFVALQIWEPLWQGTPNKDAAYLAAQFEGLKSFWGIFKKHFNKYKKQIIYNFVKYNLRPLFENEWQVNEILEYEIQGFRERYREVPSGALSEVLNKVNVEDVKKVKKIRMFEDKYGELPMIDLGQLITVGFNSEGQLVGLRAMSNNEIIQQEAEKILSDVSKDFRNKSFETIFELIEYVSQLTVPNGPYEFPKLTQEVILS